MQNNHLLPGYNNIEKLIKDLRTRPESYWLKRGELKVLKLFSEMSHRVPAYKDFLRKNKINPEKIKNAEDLKSVPPVDKNNYLKAYPLEKLCWDGKLKEKRWVISSTSGTTGEPFYFPREDSQDQQYALSAEIYEDKDWEDKVEQALSNVDFSINNAFWKDNGLLEHDMKKSTRNAMYKFFRNLIS
jgi:phenylacetate-CoA ligase